MAVSQTSRGERREKFSRFNQWAAPKNDGTFEGGAERWWCGGRERWFDASSSCVSRAEESSLPPCAAPEVGKGSVAAVSSCERMLYLIGLTSEVHPRITLVPVGGL
ncbi:hypothetical protein NL676_037571 [Syzygium grande]|nr:hypothetical protein NL676_037571 [Syzygium grande]